jgi:hypothetical protein
MIKLRLTHFHLVFGISKGCNNHVILALNTLTIEHDALTNFVVTLDRLMDCD